MFFFLSMSNCSPCLVSCACTWKGFGIAVVTPENLIVRSPFQKPLTSLRLLKERSPQTSPRYLYFPQIIQTLYLQPSTSLFVLPEWLQVHFACSGSALWLCNVRTLYCLRSTQGEPALVLCRWQPRKSGTSKLRKSVSLKCNLRRSRHFVKKYVLNWTLYNQSQCIVRHESPFVDPVSKPSRCFA